MGLARPALNASGRDSKWLRAFVVSPSPLVFDRDEYFNVDTVRALRAGRTILVEPLHAFLRRRVRGPWYRRMAVYHAMDKPRGFVGRSGADAMRDAVAREFLCDPAILGVDEASRPDAVILETANPFNPGLHAEDFFRCSP